MRKRSRRVAVLASVVAVAGSVGLSGCGSAGSSNSGPAAFGTPTEAPDTGQAGTGRAGDIVVPKGSYVRVPGGTRLRVDITNNGGTPDELVAAGSNVGSAGTLAPDPIPIPAHSTVHVGTGPTSVTLPVTGSLDPGETLAVTLTFAKSGQVLVYALTSS